VSATPGTTTVPVPDVVGRSRDDAIRRLRELGFATTAIVARCDLGPASCELGSGHVWRVTPSPGEMIAPGSAVVIRVNP
jgi:beta-lactam-binding protein with PASTA domain